jgi:hypothetical protein
VNSQIIEDEMKERRNVGMNDFKRSAMSSEFDNLLGEFIHQPPSLGSCF